LCFFSTHQVLALLPVTRELLSKVKLGKKVRRMAESNELDTGSFVAFVKQFTSSHTGRMLIRVLLH
jgi:hypothetical protein